MYWNYPCSFENFKVFVRLIETWDVLKYRNRRTAPSRNTRLIETWDVLKSEINSTIESVSRRLIETWDVLKYECIVQPLVLYND